jgi:hypothetical protein
MPRKKKSYEQKYKKYKYKYLNFKNQIESALNNEYLSNEYLNNEYLSNEYLSNENTQHLNNGNNEYLSNEHNQNLNSGNNEYLNNGNNHWNDINNQNSSNENNLNKVRNKIFYSKDLLGYCCSYLNIKDISSLSNTTKNKYFNYSISRIAYIIASYLNKKYYNKYIPIKTNLSCNEYLSLIKIMDIYNRLLELSFTLYDNDSSSPSGWSIVNIYCDYDVLKTNIMEEYIKYFLKFKNKKKIDNLIEFSNNINNYEEEEENEEEEEEDDEEEGENEEEEEEDDEEEDYQGNNNGKSFNLLIFDKDGKEIIDDRYNDGYNGTEKYDGEETLEEKYLKHQYEIDRRLLEQYREEEQEIIENENGMRYIKGEDNLLFKLNIKLHELSFYDEMMLREEDNGSQQMAFHKEHIRNNIKQNKKQNSKYEKFIKNLHPFFSIKRSNRKIGCKVNLSLNNIKHNTFLYISLTNEELKKILVRENAIGIFFNNEFLFIIRNIVYILDHNGIIKIHSNLNKLENINSICLYEDTIIVFGKRKNIVFFEKLNKKTNIWEIQKNKCIIFKKGYLRDYFHTSMINFKDELYFIRSDHKIEKLNKETNKWEIFRYLPLGEHSSEPSLCALIDNILFIVRDDDGCSNLILLNMDTQKILGTFTVGNANRCNYFVMVRKNETKWNDIKLF